MKVKFWGIRGSMPSPATPAAVEEKIHQVLRGAAGIDLTSAQAIEQYLQRVRAEANHIIGGNTTCVEVRANDQLLILDAGSGLRLLGYELMNSEFGQGEGMADLLISHTHWDHIQGLPFFRPSFVAGNRLTFYSPHPHLEAALIGQQDQIYFPVSLNYLSADILVRRITVDTWTGLGELRVYPVRMSYPNESYGYRVEHQDKCLVYATHLSYQPADSQITQTYVNLCRHADLLIFDAQPLPDGDRVRTSEGFDPPVLGAELAHRSHARRLVLFHYDPAVDDQTIYAGLKQAEAYLVQRGSLCQVIVAHEGLEIEW